MFLKFSVTPVGNGSVWWAALQQQYSWSLEEFSYIGKGFRAGRSDIPIVLSEHYITSLLTGKQLVTLTGSSVFCIGRNLSCRSKREVEILILQPGIFFSHAWDWNCTISGEGNQKAQTLLFFRENPPSWPRPQPLAPNGKLWLIHLQPVNLGNPVELGSFISGKNGGGFSV